MKPDNVVPFPAIEPPPPQVGSIEAEQALLGAALVNPAAAKQCGWLAPEDFIEPVHGRIWAVIRQAADMGQRADPVTLKAMFDADPSLSDLDGGQYLAQLGRLAVPVREAGEYGRHVKRAARMRELFRVAHEMREAALDPSPTADPATIIGGARARLDALCADESSATARTAYAVINEIVVEMTSPRRSWTTGIRLLDESFGGGLPEGYVVGIEGRPKSGKSVAMQTLALATARAKVPTCYLALEMGGARIVQRMLAHVGGFNSAMFKHADEYLMQRVERARPELDYLPLYLMDCPAIRFSRLQSLADQLMQTHGIRCFVLDYWQLVKPDGRVTNRAEFLADVAQWCADHAHEHGTTWLVASQENRTGESYGSDGLVKACDWLAGIEKHDVKLHHGTLGPVETVWLDVRYARDGNGESIGSIERPMLMIHPCGPHLSGIE